MAQPLRTNYKRLSLLLCAVLLLLTSVPFLTANSYAALPQLSDIRVTLFIDVRGTVPSITLSSPKGVNIGIRQPAGAKKWFSTTKPVRSSIDQYMVDLLETSDYVAAKRVYTKLVKSPNPAFLFSRSIKGKTVYAVYAGPYASKDNASSAKTQIMADASVSSLLSTSQLQLTGPLHWNAGTYATEAEALKQQAALAQNGILAQIAYHQNQAGSLVYSVWIGEAADQAQLDAAKAQALKAMPGLSLSSIDSSLSYLLKKDDASAGSAAGDIVTHYTFNATNQKVWITPIDSTIKVQERYGRSYRGGIELSQYNGKLAVINQLPFQQYLYSVVGSELSSTWPLEALKAQVVAARTYALKQGMKYKIAHISDTTYDQAYFGAGKEFKDGITAVDTTAGEVLVGSKGLITPFYFSNSGGVTADPSEIWGNPIDYIQSVPSPDEDAQKNKLMWNRVQLPDGIVGYVRSDLMKPTGETNPAGLPFYEIQGSNVNVRISPSAVDSAISLAKLNIGDLVVSFDQSVESNTFSWIRGPYSATELLNAMNSKARTAISGTLKSLSVTSRGPSGRVTGIQANGQNVNVPYPDALRGAMNGLPSTRFEIEETARYTVLGADGAARSFPEQDGPLYALDASGSQPQAISGDSLLIMDSDNKVRLATKKPAFRFIGFGNGHGLGLSQWGARVWAELGYDYQYILKYYYQGVSIVKE